MQQIAVAFKATMPFHISRQQDVVEIRKIVEVQAFDTPPAADSSRVEIFTLTEPPNYQMLEKNHPVKLRVPSSRTRH